MNTGIRPLSSSPAIAALQAKRAKSTKSSLIITIVLSAVVIGSIGAMFFGNLLPVGKGAMALVLMLALIFYGVHVGISMILASVFGVWAVGGWNALGNSFETLTFRGVGSWSLSVVPMFIFMGILLWRSGATARLYDAARAWTNWLPGGLAITTNFAGAGLAAVSGSTIGITYALGRLGIPEMLRSKYDTKLATGSVLASGLSGQLLPPSILMVIYAGVAGTPVGKQLLAGIVPGIMLPIMFSIMIVLMATFKPSLAPREDHATTTFLKKLKLAVGTWPILAMMVLIIGGIFSGVFTATEAGAYGALFAVVVTLIFSGLKQGFRDVLKTLMEATSASAGILLLMAGAAFVTRMLSLSGLSASLVTFVEGLNLSAVALLLVLIVIYLILGMALDAMTMVILTVPLMIPILESTGVSLLLFGAFIVLLGELAVITPPVGMLSFIVHKIVQNPEVNQGHKISLGQVFSSALIFIPVPLIVLLLMVFFPEVATWLPEAGNAK